MIFLLNEINYSYEGPAFPSNEKKISSANCEALINERLCCLLYPWTYSRFRVPTTKKPSAKANLP